MSGDLPDGWFMSPSGNPTCRDAALGDDIILFSGKRKVVDVGSQILHPADVRVLIARLTEALAIQEVTL